MFTFLTILIIIAALFLIFVVVIQNSKGGGLAAGFASSNQVMGVRKTTDFLEKATWISAGSLVFLCIIIPFTIRKGANTTGGSELKEEIQNAVPAQDPNAIAPFGTSVPLDEGSETQTPTAPTPMPAPTTPTE